MKEMHKKNKLKAIVAFAVALAFMLPTSAMFANDTTNDITNDVTTVQVTKVRFEPPSQTVEKGETFTASYYVEPTDWIIGANFVTISFDPTLLQANSVSKGTFFGGKEIMFSGGTIDNTLGVISDGFALVLKEDAVNSPGSVFVISFTAKDTFGISPLTLSDVTVKNNTGQSVPITVESGSVTVGEGGTVVMLTLGVSGHGTTVPAPGVYAYGPGTVVDLEAIPDIGWLFDHWDGDVADPNSAMTNITMDANKTVTAYFTGEDSYTLSVSTVGGGHVDVVPDKDYYLYGEEPELTAVADSGWTFDSWSGDLSGNTNPTTIFMNGNKDVTATFTEEQSNPPTSDVDTLPRWKRIIPFSVTATAFDDTCVANVTLWYRYSENGTEWTDWTAYGTDEEEPWSWLFTGSDGYYEFYSIAVDVHNNVEDPPDVADASTGIDTTPPETEIILSGTMGDNDWYTSVVTVTLNATDDLSGVESTWYKIDGGYWNPYFNPFKVSKEGYHEIEAYSFDWAGNREKPPKIAEFKIDTKPPVTTYEFDGMMGETGWFISPVTVSFSAQDATSGVNYTMYKIDEGTWTKYAEPFNITEDGTYTIYYNSTDRAGNKEETNEAPPLKIERDFIPPVTTHVFEGIMGMNNWYTSNVVVELTAEDNAAGMEFTYYKIDEGEWTKKKYTGPFTFIVSEDGEHELRYYSVDKVKNKEDDKGPYYFNIDKTLPTIELTWDNDSKKLIADVSDETSGVAKVEFYVNSEYRGEATEYPYEWEVSKPKKGDKGQAIVFDKAGNAEISNIVDAVSQSQDMSIGWTFLIGWISNVEETGNIITAQAIRLRYIEISSTGINKGFVKMDAVEFSSHNLLGRTLRSFSRMSPVIGIFKGGITIEGE